MSDVKSDEKEFLHAYSTQEVEIIQNDIDILKKAIEKLVSEKFICWIHTYIVLGHNQLSLYQ